ncbi:c-type cytochrome biogenesis protein CcmI [Stella sp.]|uniref:c-type cytochrome biogenesis protein CcmI n=1 Tax=Stella sp. TaxID=2912054 RepID=UPI0035B4732C
MTMFWALAALTAAAVVGLLVRPLLRAGGAGADRLAYDLEVYRDQLAEVERARAAGEVGEEEAAGSRLEIERRILAAADRGAAERSSAGGSASGRHAAAAIALALLLPAGALVVYGWHGAPRQPGQPLAQRGLPAPDAGDPRAQDEAVAALVRRLEERPDDIEGWERLARALVRLQRFADAAEAYRHRLGLGAERPDLHAQHGEALTLAAGGIVTPAARAAFERAGADPRALYFLGEAAAQSGDLDAAIRRWTALEAASAADAPWRPMLRRRIEEAARERGVPVPAPATGTPALPPGGEAVMRLSPEERAQAIRGMVAGLEERLRSQPEDREGWRRLVQALHVLGEPARLAAALERAVAAHPDDIELRLDLANSQLERAGGDDVLPPDFVGTMREAARIAPDHPQVLWYLGRIAADEGRPEEARRLWTRLLDRLPPASPARAAVEARRAALPEK